MALADYKDVAERVPAFYQTYPDGSIQTELLYVDEDVVRFKAMIFRDRHDQNPSTGHAEEFRGSSAVNKTSATENCFHPDTEVLTQAGWVKLGDYVSAKSKEPVMSYQISSGELRFDRPTRHLDTRADEMILIEDSLTAQLVTPEHRVLTKQGEWTTAAEVFRRTAALNARQTLRNPNSPQAGHYSGGSGVGGEDVARMLQWIIADGCIDERAIKFDLHKQGKVERLRALMNRLEISYTESAAGSRTGFYLGRSDLYQHFFPEGKTLSHQLLMRLTANEARAFIEESLHTNGTLSTRGGIVLRVEDRNYLENMVTLGVLHGYDASSLQYEMPPGPTSYPTAQNIHRVCLKKNSVRRHHYRCEKRPGGRVVCLTMPLGTLLTRWNGKIVISSNCETSAIGRALASAGFGGSRKFASRDEIASAERRESELAARRDLYEQATLRARDWVESSELEADSELHALNLWADHHGLDRRADGRLSERGWRALAELLEGGPLHLHEEQAE